MRHAYEAYEKMRHAYNILDRKPERRDQLEKIKENTG
jgi:hypothetical protein